MVGRRRIELPTRRFSVILDAVKWANCWALTAQVAHESTLFRQMRESLKSYFTYLRPTVLPKYSPSDGQKRICAMIIRRTVNVINLADYDPRDRRAADSRPAEGRRLARQ
jgi:predicted chitinase